MSHETSLSGRCYAMTYIQQQMNTTERIIRAFQPDDQDAARALIEEGLAEHFEHFDPGFNPDLADIWAQYIVRGHAFFVAARANTLIGTGGLVVRRAEGTGEIVRVSVSRAARGQGLGRALVERLLAEACARGLREALVETNLDWTQARRLYEHCGFVPYATDETSVYYRLSLASV